jgi:HAE1 family hydrophobic/amphiphilic exporter-1
MRLWLNRRNAALADAERRHRAGRAQNAYVPAGQVAMPPTKSGEPFQLTIDVPGNLTRAEEFEQIIVKTGPTGQITRIRDVGRVELGAQTYSQFFKMNDHVAGGIAIFQLPDANALDTATRVRAAMKELSSDFPQGLVYEFRSTRRRS